MAVQVRGYTKHVNGKLVTVHGYQANNRGGPEELVPTPQTPIVREMPFRGSILGIAGPGQYRPLPEVAGGDGGVVAYLAHPGGSPKPIVRYRRTILPKHGIYRIPKRG